MKYNFTNYKRELKLTLENTQDLYKQALEITDFDWQGEQIDALYVATWAQINKNAGENVAPELITDHDVREVKDVIVSTAKTLQMEAKA